MSRKVSQRRRTIALAALAGVSLIAVQAQANSSGAKSNSKSAAPATSGAKTTPSTTSSSRSTPATTSSSRSTPATTSSSKSAPATTPGASSTGTTAATRPASTTPPATKPSGTTGNSRTAPPTPIILASKPAPTPNRPITAYWGEISPFWGEISPFWGEISPFSTASNGNSEAALGAAGSSFWGSLPGYTNAKGKSNGEAVGEYWKEAGDQWKDVMAAWSEAQKSKTGPGFSDVRSELNEIFSDAAAFWGDTYQARAGVSLTTGLVNPLLAKYGITSDPNSLSKLTKTQQALLFMEFYDGLMRHAGADHVDHWMATTRWNPHLTQTQGSGTDTVIGLLDFTVLNGAIVKNNVVNYGGTSKFTNGHGAAVAGLMVGAHDGTGVMGISPNSRVVAFNPFDETGTAGWEDIATGLKMLTTSKASVVNMSLGVPGSVLPQGWNDVFSRSDVSPTARNALFVLAAGNDGVTQTEDIKWNFATNPQLLVVGSVTLDGKISNFSNRPGTACLTDGGVCQPGARLMDRFLVAPGELILVEDDKGGVKRATGTSFAAPLVTGAASLIQDRWPWFAAKPTETAEILLRSAKDLGAPGVDPVFGAGLLDITAAQSPLDFGALKWYTVSNSGKMTEYSVKKVLNDFDSESLKGLQSVGLYYYAFEAVGSVERDFGIPLSSRLVGETFTTKSGASEFFQDYIFDRLNAWARNQNRSFAQGGLGFGPGDFTIANPWGADLTLSLAPRQSRSGFVAEGLETQSRLHLSSDRATADFGFGDGARYLAAGTPGSMAADFDPALGGASPLLGFASGGAFIGYQAHLTDRLDLTAGATQRRDRRDDSAGSAVIQPGSAAETYAARAATFGLNYAVTDRVRISGSYVRLQEEAAILGVQSLEASDLGAGAASDAFTLGLTADFGGGVNLAVSGSVGQTRAGDGFLRTDGEGLQTSAWQATLSAEHLLARGDTARISVMQPLFIERGRLAFSGVEVIDRLTGEKGVVTRSFDVAQERPMAAEVQYGRAWGETEVSFFGRVDVNPLQMAEEQIAMGGVRIRIDF